MHLETSEAPEERHNACKCIIWIHLNELPYPSKYSGKLIVMNRVQACKARELTWEGSLEYRLDGFGLLAMSRIYIKVL